jgi:hypothetical protein
MFDKPKTIEKEGIILYMAQPTLAHRERIKDMFKEVAKTKYLLVIKLHPRDHSDAKLYRKLANETGIDVVLIKGDLYGSE